MGPERLCFFSDNIIFNPKQIPEPDTILNGTWLRGFFVFWRSDAYAFQRFEETRSHTKCERGVGDPQQASENPYGFALLATFIPNSG